MKMASPRSETGPEGLSRLAGSLEVAEGRCSSFDATCTSGYDDDLLFNHGAKAPLILKRSIAAIDHNAVGGMIRRRLAHEIDRDAAEIGGLAEPPYRNARH